MQIIERYRRFDDIPEPLRENYVEHGQSWVLSHVVGLVRKNSELLRENVTLKNELREFRNGRERVVSAVEKLVHIGK